jgi:hypothetical protein
MTTPCKYGLQCYRKNPDHFKHYSHPTPPAPAVAAAPASGKKETKKRAPGTQENPWTVALGVDSPWAYRASGKASYYQIQRGDEEDEIESLAEESSQPLLMSEVFETQMINQLPLPLHHGDVVDIGDYRGCGCFIVEPVDAQKTDYYLYKTLEEMGYGVPLAFSDAPQGYYNEVN